MKPLHPLLLPTLLLAAFALSASLALRSLRREISLRDRANTNARELESMLTAFQTQRGALENAITRAAPPVPDMCRAYLPGVKVDVSEPRITPLPHGFRHQAVDLDLRGAPWTLLRDFLENAEFQSPPWRVTSLDLRAGLDNLEGSLRLEALDKPAPAP